jgi:hypothetical protein
MSALISEKSHSAQSARDGLHGPRSLMQIAEACESARSDDTHGRCPGEKRCAAIRIIAVARIIESLQPRLNLGTRHEHASP